MRFNSLVYMAFLAVVVLGARFLPARPRKAWLLVASYVFYGSWHYPYLALLFGAGALSFFGAHFIAAVEDRKRRVTIVVGANLALLGVFKYADWVLESWGVVASAIGLGAPTLLDLVLPLGISFYLFQCMSYVIDVGRRRETPYRFWDVQLFVAFFPQLIAGPIMRAKELLPQLTTNHKRPIEVGHALTTIVSGLFLKVVLADGLAPNVDAAFARAPSALSALDVYVMATGFGLQIYFDFAGYSLMAIGSARLLGIELVQNFNHPYVARSPADFWARWHMSLSRWIRDYLFHPLAGGRSGWLRLAFAALVAMTLCGLWHGAGFTFIVWGAYHGVLIAGYHVLSRKKPAVAVPRARALLEDGAKVVVTFGLVTLGWVWFRAQSVAQAFELSVRGLLPLSHGERGLSGVFYLQVAALVLATWAAPSVARRLAPLGRLGATERAPLTLSFTRGAVVGLLLAVTLVYLRGQKEFVYFQF